MALKTITCGIVLLIFSTFCHSEVIRIPVGQQGSDGMTTTPTHGQTKESVLESFGEPVTKTNAVGEPPISQWEYNRFTVYFEANRVIHTVKKFIAKVPAPTIPE